MFTDNPYSTLSNCAFYLQHGIRLSAHDQTQPETIQSS